MTSKSMSCAAPFYFLRGDNRTEQTHLAGDLVPLGPSAADNDPAASRINVVFTASNFNTSTYRLTDERSIELARKIIATDDPASRGILERAPFNRHAQEFQFWYWKTDQAPVLTRGASEMCSAVGSLDSMDAAVEETLKGMGMENIIFMNLLADDCRPQGTWFKISGAAEAEDVMPVELFSSFDREAFWAEFWRNPDPALLTDAVRLTDFIFAHLNMRALISKLFEQFGSPRTYLPIAPSVVKGDRGLTPEETAALAGHEFGHTWRLWDLYQENLSARGKGVPKAARLLAELDRDRDLLSVLGLKQPIARTLENLGVHPVALPEVRVNLLQEIISREELTRALGLPFGWPHCAVSKDQGRMWVEKLGVANGEGYFLEEGCLYFGKDSSLGPNHFFRSSNSLMYRSGSPESDYDPVETAWIEWQINCLLHPEEKTCATKPWEK